MTTDPCSLCHGIFGCGLQVKRGNCVWYYKDGDKEIGPVDKDELQQLLNDRTISGETLVRGIRVAHWRPLKELATGKKPQRVSPSSPPRKSPTVERASPAPGSGKPAVPAVARPEKKRFQFTGSGSEYFKIWIVNIVLSVLTLGIYSAWAKVRRKQYFYGSTEVNDASFNYLADPVKILKGRIVVFIGFVCYSLVNQFYPVASLVLLVILLPALPWFVVRSLAFNARNSAIRNIRFNFKATYLEAVKVFLFWPLLLPLTLGFIFPYLLYRQKKFLVENSSYGTAQFHFRATGKDYYMLFVGLLLPFFACVAVAVAAGFFFQPVSILVIVIFYLYAMAYIAVKSNNLLYNSSNLTEHGFEATMAIKEYAFIVITNTVATVLTLGFFYPFAQVRAYRYQIDHLALMAVGNLDQFVAAEQQQISALGDELSDFLDFDLGV